MKELSIFTENEKIKVRPLLKAKENGDHEAAVEYTIMYLNGCRRALAEYRTHPSNEKVVPQYADSFFDDLFPSTVRDKIEELEDAIKENENWLHNNLMDW